MKSRISVFHGFYACEQWFDKSIQFWKIKMLLDNAFLYEKMPKTFIQSVVLCKLDLCRHRQLIGQQ